MIVGNSIRGVVLVVRACRSGVRVASDNVVVLVSFHQHLPQFICISFCMIVLDVGGAGESLSSNLAVSALSVGIVTVILGESLFEDGRPHGLVLGHLSKDSLILLTIVHHGQIVVDYNSVEYTEGVEVYSIDARAVKLVFSVMEDLLHAAWDLCY